MAWKVINEFISAENGAALAKAGYSPSCNPNTQDNLSDEENELFGAIDPGRLDSFIPFKAIDDKEPEWQSAWEEVKAA
jgi:spermidine/putrescine transport system substrate-binding protein